MKNKIISRLGVIQKVRNGGGVGGWFDLIYDGIIAEI